MSYDAAFTATSNDGYVVEKWTVNGAEMAGGVVSFAVDAELEELMEQIGAGGKTRINQSLLPGAQATARPKAL